MKLEPSIFVGDANEALARVYATLSREGLSDVVELTGELVGPQCRYSQTLPARIRFVDRGPGATLLAEAAVPDPCFWSPELPFMYRATIQVATPTAASTTFARPFGIRRLGIQGASIHLDGKRFVPRGVARRSIRVADLKEARETASAIYVIGLSDEVLEEASEAGVLLAVRLKVPDNTVQDRVPVLQSELNRLACWPAVAIVLLDGDFPAGKELRLAARNTLLGQCLTSVDTVKEPPPWAHLLWWQIDPDDVPTIALPHDIPIIVYCPAPEDATIEESRRACDRLQADLAPLGDFAGYFT